MSTIILTMTESITEIVSGVPISVTFDTNIPSNIFYTFDGTDPSEDNGQIAIDEVFLPTSGVTFTLKVIAISGSDSSDILEVEYATEQNITKSRLTGKEGINITPVNKPIVDHRGVDADGNDALETHIPFQELDLQTSRANNRGIKSRKTETSIDFIQFPELEPVLSVPVRSDLSSVNFDPRAKVITINGYSVEDRAAQQIEFINRPHDSFSSNSNSFNSKMYPAITGNLVRMIAIPGTDIVMFYYYESRESRWIVSKQQYNLSELSLSPKVNTLVFRWVSRKSNSALF